MEYFQPTEAYNSFLQFVNLIESDMPSYTIDFLKKESNFSVDAKFKIVDNGNYVLSFSTKESIPLKIFKNSLTILQSEWYNIVFDNIYTQQIESTIYKSEKPNEFRITTKSFRSSSEDEWESSNICAFYKYDHNVFNPDKSCIIGISHEPIIIKIKEFEIIIYWGRRTSPKRTNKDERFLMFYSKTKTDLLTFKRLVEAIRVAWGIISGYYIGKNVYYLSFNPENGLAGISFAYHNLQEELVSYRGMIDSGNYDNISESDLRLTIYEFERLASILYGNIVYLRTGQLLINASNDEGLPKGGIAAIALEAISGEIENQMENERNKFKMPKELTEEIQEIINRFKDNKKISEEQQEHYLKKLNGFSTPFNSDKLSKPFHSLGIKLTKTEEGIIKNRNKILHGRLPEKVKGLDFAAKLKDDELILYTSNKLIMLCTMLLLKLAHIEKQINDWGVTIIVKKRLMKNGMYIGNGGIKHRQMSDIDPVDDSPEWLI